MAKPDQVSLSKLQKARGRMLLKHKFISTLMLALPLVERNDLPTAATDMERIFYNPQFFTTLTEGGVQTVLAHEVLHVMFKHGLRRGHRNPRRWNIACDFAINLILLDDGFEPVEGWLLDHQYRDMSAEQIYDKREQEEEERRKKRGKGDPGQPGQGQPGQGQPGDEDGDQPAPGGFGDDLIEPGSEDGTGLDPARAAEIERRIQSNVATAAAMARMAGNVPGHIQRLIDELLNPVVPWQQVLWDYMNRVVQADESWARRNRRFKHHYLPARHDLRMGGVVFIGDTSGSISNNELAKGAAEVVSCVETVSPEWVKLVWADTRVAGEDHFDRGDEITFEPKGGGGTDMRVPLEHVAQYEPDVVVLMTDGETPWPKHEPPYPLIVLCTTNANVPIGQVIRV